MVREIAVLKQLEEAHKLLELDPSLAKIVKEAARLASGGEVAIYEPFRRRPRKRRWKSSSGFGLESGSGGRRAEQHAQALRDRLNIAELDYSPPRYRLPPAVAEGLRSRMNERLRRVSE